jgi:hypothetical protein
MTCGREGIENDGCKSKRVSIFCLALFFSRRKEGLVVRYKWDVRISAHLTTQSTRNLIMRKHENIWGTGIQVLITHESLNHTREKFGDLINSLMKFYIFLSLIFYISQLFFKYT